jgi:tripartite-type tricarboxylate transporter receptor subunit TctC
MRPSRVCHASSHCSSCLLLVALDGTAGVSAEPGEASGLALARANNCMACHKVDQRMVGPRHLPHAHIRQAHDPRTHRTADRSNESRTHGAKPMKMTSKLQFLRRLCGAAALGFCAIAAHAADYPDRPVKLLIGFGAGAGSDVVGRLFAQSLEQRLGKPFVAENRPGAASNLAAEAVMRSPADGYTLYLGSTTNVVNDVTLKSPTVRYSRDFTTVVLACSAPVVLVVGPHLKVNTVKELVALTNADPGRVSYASSGVGTGLHLTGELFKVRTTARMTHIPYQGTAQAMSDLLAGRVDAMFTPVSTVRAHVDSGKLRALAIIGTKRVPLLANVPTVAEEGIANFDGTLWWSIAVPKGTPADVTAKLRAATLDALKDPAVLKALEAQGLEPANTPAGGYDAFMESELNKWSEMAKAAGFAEELSK